ncbi:MAG: winged helix-turn-helix transcriptional regulator [Nanoarchaeota archaeon]|nr:winged helix-turn-helix transcriptional regulator [Nanoarchaeota archaeon]
MELFNQTRKSILQVISREKSSASTIAKQVNLSLPYTLSQLAILEAAGSIKKERSPKKSYGKPRLEYSISRPFMELSILTEHVGNIITFQGNQPLTENYLQLLATIPQANASAFSEYYWKHSEHQNKIIAMGLLSSAPHTIELLAITEKEHLEELRKVISHFESTISGRNVKIICWVHLAKEIVEGATNKDDYYVQMIQKVKPVIDPQEIFERIRKEGNNE